MRRLVRPRSLAELCVHDPARNVWRRFRPRFDPRIASLAERPASRRDNGLAYDPAHDLLFFIGNAFPRPWGPPVLCAMRFDPAEADWMGPGGK